MSLENYATYGEALIARKLVTELVNRGHAVSIWNGGDEAEIEDSTNIEALLAELAASGEDELVADGVWFYLIFGNERDGSELISDCYDNEECNAIFEIVNN
tara:strand:+ start:283 stop:585 length:303 start_codon:yes stop_codon:yes gene_type:complete